MQKPKIFIVLPVYNEDTVLRSIITELLKYEYKVVVVDDGSTQKQELLLSDLPVYILRHFINLGQGAALQTGTSFSLRNGADYIVHFDADGQHNPAEINSLLFPILTDESDVTLGSRFILKANSHDISLARKIILHSARYLNYIFTGILLSDAHNGFRAMNKQAAQKIILRENRMAHASEILFLLKKNKLRFKEVPVTIDYSKYSRQKGQSLWNSVRILFDLLLHKFFE